MDEYKKKIWVVKTPKEIYIFRDFKKVTKYLRENISRFSITIKEI